MRIDKKNNTSITPDIRIDRNGIWYYRGVEMFRKDIVNYFYQYIKKDIDGRYLIEIGDDKIYLEVEDTIFVVKSVNRLVSKQDNKEYMELILSDDSVEQLEPDTLYIGHDHVLYCSVKEKKYNARFLRPSYYQIVKYIEYDSESDKYKIFVNGNSYNIKIND